jgi:hypothetical protein
MGRFLLLRIRIRELSIELMLDVLYEYQLLFNILRGT